MGEGEGGGGGGWGRGMMGEGRVGTQVGRGRVGEGEGGDLIVHNQTVPQSTQWNCRQSGSRHCDDRHLESEREGEREMDASLTATRVSSGLNPTSGQFKAWLITHPQTRLSEVAKTRDDFMAELPQYFTAGQVCSANS